MKRKNIAADLLIAVLTGITALPTAHSKSMLRPSPTPGQNPVLIKTCLISNDIQELAAFYERILKTAPKFDGDRYAEFQTGTGVLSLFDARAQESYIPGSAESSANRSAIMEFEVTDVDGEYARLQGIVKTWVKPPTTQPWGTRSIYFRDPDGNLVTFYAPIKSR
ncbi:MAG TPA: VOC family protein [Candidatus Acidoferrales bacterium]